MRVDLLAIGSRGDVQPFVALGVGLKNAGEEVRIITLGGFEDLVGAHGLEHLVAGDSPQQIASTAAGQDWIRKRQSTTGFLRGFVRIAQSRIEQGMAVYWSGRRDADVLVVSPMGLLVGVSLAERMGIPMISAQVEPPTVPTAYGWNGRKSAGVRLERAWATVQDRAFYLIVWNILRGATNGARKRTLGLPPLPRMPLGRTRVPVICGASPTVLPPQPDFGHWLHMTGYWFIEDQSSWTPSPELLDFLQSGPPPLLIGLGSTPFPGTEAATETVLNALNRNGDRGLIVAGGTGMKTGRLSETVLSIKFAPYEWLLPKVKLVVHQGGAGVTSLVLRAGLPSVIIPLFGVHPVWGRRVFELGASARPIPAAKLTSDALAAAIVEADSDGVRQRASAIGEQIRKEDGIAKAVEIIRAYAGNTASSAAVGHHHAR